ncbi:hypothetical protein BP5796_01736 [Coleophoma crateriformis]|uniref:WSC domain-containing protein n=1 Tax=Coleophoma crateriformis TaxID=565419 RepID=A0A3D8T194_9HELO|nr:hypothetical protein BP5796_01736 [Coleophoma crateriformis]
MFSLLRSLNVLLLPFLVALLPSLASGQQYEGETIPNSLPSVPGSELAYIKITDPKGSGSNLTLTNYISHNSAGDRVDGSSTKRAVIVIHGAERDPGTYMSNLLSALSQVPNSDVDFDSVAICAPYFPNRNDKTTGYPWDHLPKHAANLIAGHSLDGQFVNRYAAVGTELGLTTPISYWIGNPNSFVWFTTDRPLDDSDCSEYDVWRDGFTNYIEINTYGDAIVEAGRDAVLARYNSRSIAYGRGVQDLGDTSSTCAPGTTGGNRNERFFNFIKAFPPSCPNPGVVGPCSTIDYVQAGHDASVMFASSAGQDRLFLDNFNGTGDIAFDFGYPRRQTGDDPYPNSALNGTASTGPTVYYAGNMSYYGCFTDQDPRSLTYTAYSSISNTIGLCTSTCNDAGYTIAGMEYGSECYCGAPLT